MFPMETSRAQPPPLARQEGEGEGQEEGEGEGCLTHLHLPQSQRRYVCMYVCVCEGRGGEGGREVGGLLVFTDLCIIINH